MINFRTTFFYLACLTILGSGCGLESSKKVNLVGENNTEKGGISKSDNLGTGDKQGSENTKSIDTSSVKVEPSYLNFV